MPIIFAPAGATGTASLSCFGAPDGTTCDVQPSTLQLSGASARASVLVRYADAPDSAPPGSYQVQVLARTNSFSSVLAIPIELTARVATLAANSSKPTVAVPKSSDEPAAAAFELSSRRLEFIADDRQPNASAREITLTNLRSAPLSVAVDTTADFTQTNDCDKELAAAATCHISVRAKSAQSTSGSLKITTAAGTATVELDVKDHSRFKPED